jgi:hypothetical protein
MFRPIAILFGWTILVFAQTTTCIVAEGSASMADKSLQQARLEALNQARAEAVRIGAGAKIKARRRAGEKSRFCEHSPQSGCQPGDHHR